VLEIKALENDTIVLIIKKCLPKSEKTVTYGLILEVIKLNSLDCKSVIDLGLLYFKMNNPVQCTMEDIKIAWEFVEELVLSTKPVDVVVHVVGTPKKKTRKRKAEGALGNPKTSGKKIKKTPKLQLHICVNMLAPDIAKLDKEQMKEISKLYN
jgi:hypothetical protein